MTTSQTLPGGSSACPACGTDVDLTGADTAVVDCPVCGAPVPVTGPDPIAGDEVEITEVVRDYRGGGYEAEMRAAPGDRVTCGACGMQLAAEEIQVDDVRRARDTRSGDVTVAGVALTCPNCSARGHLVLDYGADGDPGEASLLERFEYGHIQA